MSDTHPPGDDAEGDPHAAPARADLPVYRCPYCGQPFAAERLRTLHYGLSHPEDLDEAEVTAFREAHADESDAIRQFRLRALGALVVLYFLLLMVFALV
jgi:hypothetical protein